MISDVLGKLVTVKMFFTHVKQSNKVPQKSPDLQNVTDFSVPPPTQRAKSAKLVRNVLSTFPNFFI